jgi:hypothetical protein
MSETAQLVELDASYPIGKYQRPESVSVHQRMEAIAALAALPGMLSDAVKGLDREQLDTPYREGGWTVRQVIHHVPDSHMNAYVRFKLALTENEPTIKPYDEAAWARLNDTAETPPEVSLALLENLHKRWVVLMRGISEAGWKRQFVHPELGKTVLETYLALYAWHGRHHVAHVTELRKRMGW